MAWKLPANKRDIYSIVAETGVMPAGEFKVGRPLPTLIKPSGYTHTNVTTLRYVGGFMGIVLAFGQSGITGSGGDASMVEYANRFGIAATADRNVATFTQDAGATKTLGYYVASDPDINSNGTQGLGHCCRELVYGSGSSTTFTLGRQPTRYVGSGSGQGQTYGANSYLIPIGAYASYQVSISNLTIDGNGLYPARLTSFWFVDELTLTDCTFKSFFSGGTSTFLCRNITRLRCHVEDSNGNSGGEGYCHEDYGVYNTKTIDCTYSDVGSSSYGIRHGHYAGYGVSNKLQDGCSAHNTYNPTAKDTPFWEAAAHVGKDNDCKMINCTHSGVGGGIGLGGHQLFGWGSTGVIVSDCEANGHDLFIALDTTGTYTNISGGRYLWLIGCGDRSGNADANPNYATGPGNCTFTNVDAVYVVASGGFDNNAGAAATYGQANISGLLDFVACNITGTETDKPAMSLTSNLDCSLKIRGGCAITGNGDDYQVIELNGAAGTFTLAEVSDSAFVQNGGTSGQGAFGLAGNGVVTLVSGNTFNLGVDFMQDGGTWSGEVTEPD